MRSRLPPIALVALALAAAAAAGSSSVDYLTYRGSNDRAGYLPNANLDPAIVGTTAFGLLQSVSLPPVNSFNPERIFATPLVYTYPDYPHQIVFVATETNNIYAVDGVNGTVIASRNVDVPFNRKNDIPACGDIDGTWVGITGTPVIDPATSTAYFYSKTYSTPTAGGVSSGRYRFHAVDVMTLQEKPNYPLEIDGLPSGIDPTLVFEGGKHLQRPGLALVGNIVYGAFGGHCDFFNYTGWVIGVDISSSAVTSVYSTSSFLTTDKGGAGIWMSGAGPAVDRNGKLFVVTGNGNESPLVSPTPGSSGSRLLGMSIIGLAADASTKKLSVADFFTPFNYVALNGADRDFGAGGITLLPDYFGTTSVPHVAAAGGKAGQMYFLNADSLGGFDMGPSSGDKILGSVTPGSPIYSQAAAYPGEGGFVYVQPIAQPLLVFGYTVSDNIPTFTQIAQTTDILPFGAASPMISSLNGAAGSALVWTYTGEVAAYSAVPVRGSLTKIFSYQVTGTGPHSKFAGLGFGNGTVYAPTSDGRLIIIGSPTFSPVTATAADYGSVFIGNTSTLTVIFTAQLPVLVKSFTFSNGNFTIVTKPTLPTTLSTEGTLSFTVKFTPTGTYTATGTLDLATNYTTNPTKGTATVLTFAALRGSGIVNGPNLALSPTNLNFEGVVTGSGPFRKTLIVGNNGAKPLTFTSVGLPSGGFTVVDAPAVGTVLPSGGSVTVSVLFDPKTDGKYSSTFAVGSNGGSLDVLLTGSSAGPPVLQILTQNPDGTFGSNLNMTFSPLTSWQSQSRIVILKNIGATVLTITKSKLPLSGNITAPETAVYEGQQIPAGGNITFSVTFANGLIPIATPNTTSTGEYVLNTDDATSGLQILNFEGVTYPPHQINHNIFSNVSTGWAYMNCFYDSNPRTLPTGVTGSASPYMTVEICLSLCEAAGLQWCGLEYKGECYGGSSVAASTIDTCYKNSTRTPCNGDATENCGGPNALDVFYNYAYTGSPTPTPPPAGGGGGGGGGSGTPLITPNITGYSYVGCLVDNFNGRLFAGGYQNSSTSANMTLPLCAQICSEKLGVAPDLLAGGKWYGSELFFGVEYAQECYCSGTSSFNNTLSTACTLACNGDATTACGGPNALTVYKRDGSSSLPTSTSTTTATPSAVPTPIGVANVSDWTFVDCLGDNINGTHTLPGGFQNDTTYPVMTIPLCATICLEARKTDSRLSPTGSLFLGVEYSQECYCSSSSTFTRSPSTACTMACRGDALTVCGGPSALSVYQYTPSAPTPTSAPTSSSSSAVASPTPSGIASVADWSHLECYADNVNGQRTLQGGFQNDTTSPVMTIPLCAAICLEARQTDARLSPVGPLFLGVEYSQECFCSSTSNFTRSVSTACTMTCKGDSTTICGGPNALSVYQYNAPSSSSSSSSSTSQSATPSSSEAPSQTAASTAKYTSIGCLTDNINSSRLLAGSVQNSTEFSSMSVALCYQICQRNMNVDSRLAPGGAWYGNGTLAFFGIEYGGECYCSGTNSFQRVASTNCNMACNGDSTAICGGGNALSVYQVVSSL